MALTQRVGFACPRQLDAGEDQMRKLLQIVITPHFFSGKNGFIAHHLVSSLVNGSNAETTAIGY